MKNLIILLFLLLIISCGQVPEETTEQNRNPIDYFITNDVMCTKVPVSWVPYANLEDQWVCTVDGKRYYCDELTEGDL